MSLLAITVILVSACMHASWNYFAKRSNGGFAFVWLYLAISIIIFAPFVIGMIVLQEELTFRWIDFWLIVASGVIHLAYALLLQRGYRVGDLSLVYPIARGTGPMIVAIAAVFLFDEQLSLLGMIGILFIVISVFIFTGGPNITKSSKASLSIVYGLIIGLMIAGYTLLDKGAVSVYAVAPLLLNYGGIVVQWLLLTPLAIKNWSQVKYDWRNHRKEALGVGILLPTAYMLVLVVMTFTPVSYVAPVREFSILIGAILGAYLLKEGFGAQRIVASIVMIVGVVTIALSS